MRQLACDILLGMQYRVPNALTIIAFVSAIAALAFAIYKAVTALQLCVPETLAGSFRKLWPLCLRSDHRVITRPRASASS